MMSKRSLVARIRAAVRAYEKSSETAPTKDELETVIQAAIQAYNKEFPLKDEDFAIAITRDGKIYRGRAYMPKD